MQFKLSAAVIYEYDTLKARIGANVILSPEARKERKRHEAIYDAINLYRESHRGEWPEQTEQLKPYVDDPSVLAGVQMEEHGYSLSTGISISTNGSGDEVAAIHGAIDKYRKEHGGVAPTDAQQLRPYVSDPSILKDVKFEVGPAKRD